MSPLSKAGAAPGVRRPGPHRHRKVGGEASARAVRVAGATAGDFG